MKALLNLTTWLWLAIGLTIVGTLYFSSFAQPFDKAYLLDFYEKSQWKIPQSPRVMSDNELYQVAGMKLLAGESIFSINPEVPPLGKYIYGVSAQVFSTPYTASVVMYVLLLIATFKLSGEITKNKTAQLVMILLLASSPIVIDQVSRTMLDLPMTLFLTLHAWFILRLLKTNQDLGKPGFKSWGSLLGAGISLGAVAACKVPFFIPVILVADAVFMFRSQLRSLIFMTGLSGLTYLGMFTAYFIQGNSLIDWLKAEKWMINFYTSGSTKHLPFFNLITIVTGWYKDWWGQSQWHWTNYWSPVWPAGLVAIIATLKKTRFKLQAHQYPAGLAMSLVAFQGLQPFWPRYFLLVLPFALVCCVPAIEWLLRKKSPFILFGITLASLVYGVWFFRPSPNDVVYYFNEDWQQGDYQDVYNHLYQPDFSREEFWTTLKQVDRSLDIQNRSGTLTVGSVTVWQNQAEAKYYEVLETKLGPIEISQPVTLVRQGGRWQMVWNSEIVLPNYAFGEDTQLIQDTIRAGELRTKDGLVLSTGSHRQQVVLNLSQIDDVEPVVTAVGQAFDRGGTEVRVQLLVNSLPDKVINLGLLPPEVSEEEITNLRSLPSITIQPIAVNDREYSPLVIERGKVETVKQLEAEHPELISVPAGEVVIRKQDGTTVTPLKQTPRPAQNVILPLTLQQVLSR